MKKSLLVLIAAISCCFFVSCQKDNINTEPARLTDNELLAKLKEDYNKNFDADYNLQVDGKKVMLSEPDWGNLYVKNNHFIIPAILENSSVNEKFTVKKYLTAVYYQGAFDFEYIYTIQNLKKTTTPLSIDKIFDLSFNTTGSGLLNDDSIFIAKEKYKIQDNKLAGNYLEPRLPQKNLSKPTDDNQSPQTNYVPLPDCGGSEPTCIDWYWQTWVNGELADEEYLFTSCYCLGGGGGGSNQPSEAQLAESALEAAAGTIESTSYLLDITDEGTSTIGGVEKRTKLYKWKFVEFGFGKTASGYSIDRGIHKKVMVNGSWKWQWESLTHINHGIEGFAIWPPKTSSSLSVIAAQPTIGLYNASMDIHYEFTLTYNGTYGNTVKYDSDHSVMTLNVDAAAIPGY
ncbi:MAG: hypothetical protein QM687_02405 [Ferruginibacter sp.]